MDEMYGAFRTGRLVRGVLEGLGGRVGRGVLLGLGGRPVRGGRGQTEIISFFGQQ